MESGYDCVLRWVGSLCIESFSTSQTYGSSENSNAPASATAYDNSADDNIVHTPHAAVPMRVSPSPTLMSNASSHSLPAEPTFNTTNSAYDTGHYIAPPMSDSSSTRSSAPATVSILVLFIWSTTNVFAVCSWTKDMQVTLIESR